MIVTVIGYILIAVAALSALSILFIRNVFHAALALLVCLLCVAGIFIVLNAEFAGVVQLIVYAGGVLLLILFGIMITPTLPGTNVEPMEAISNNKIVSIIIGAGLFALLFYGLNGSAPDISESTNLSPENIGVSLMTTYAAPFALSGILLLVTLIAAIVAVSFTKPKAS